MFCTHCGKPLKDGDKVCKNCGEKVRSGKISDMIPDDVVDKTKDALNKAKDLGNKMVDQVPDSVKNKTLEVEKKVSSKLPDNLKEIAEIRINNPEASLTELGKMLKIPIGKSGVNYRLQMIIKMSL